MLNVTDLNVSILVVSAFSIIWFDFGIVSYIPYVAFRIWCTTKYPMLMGG